MPETEVTVMAALLTTIGSTLSTVIGWFGTVIESCFSTDGELSVLLPFLAIGFSIALIAKGVTYVRSFVKL